MLVTRPEPGCAATMSRLRALGWEPVAAPALEIVPLSPPLPMPGELQAVLVASANALPVLPAALHGTRLLAVGDATAARACATGFRTVASAGGDGAALAALAARMLDPFGGTLLLAARAGHGAATEAALRAAGFAVLRRDAYAARPASALPEPACMAIAAGLHAAWFFSAETARAFLGLLPAALRPALAAAEAHALSATVAAALGPLPWRRIRVAVRPTERDMLALL